MGSSGSPPSSPSSSLCQTGLFVVEDWMGPLLSAQYLLGSCSMAAGAIAGVVAGANAIAGVAARVGGWVMGSPDGWREEEVMPVNGRSFRSRAGLARRCASQLSPRRRISNHTPYMLETATRALLYWP